MCAINPRFKKRMIFDFYTSAPMTREEFDRAIFAWTLQTEETINSLSKLRCHVKETDKQAD